jgi:hypothetical protein
MYELILSDEFIAHVEKHKKSGQLKIKKTSFNIFGK